MYQNTFNQWPEHLLVLSFVLTFSLGFGLTSEKQALSVEANGIVKIAPLEDCY